MERKIVEFDLMESMKKGSTKGTEDTDWLYRDGKTRVRLLSFPK